MQKKCNRNAASISGYLSVRGARCTVLRLSHETLLRNLWTAHRSTILANLTTIQLNHLYKNFKFKLIGDKRMNFGIWIDLREQPIPSHCLSERLRKPVLLFCNHAFWHCRTRYNINASTHCQWSIETLSRLILV